MSHILLRFKDLQLDDDDYAILRNEKITGRGFFKLTEQKFRDASFKVGPATNLADFAKEVKEKKLKAYSSYKTFYPVTEKLEENDEDLQYCIDDIKYRMVDIGSATGSNEALRCEYISTILHSCLYIAGRTTKDTIVLKPQLEIAGDEASGRVDYAIKKIKKVAKYEELICITEGSSFDNEFDYLYGIVSTVDIDIEIN
ncbi:1836_t:CDS:2 [Ambispora leptoticha]|uniref:1836_t:CDS:1 n=1 Tax=Ambispora leptoticha TaxID=144679 RepID=A0A9N9GSR3_9GLOM|nr:1836_t:CDS:2 [Ambispora leptoticha]